MTATGMQPDLVDARTSAPAAGRDLRRWLQLGLAAIWLIAGILQAQTFMFTSAFARTTLAPTAEGNPAWIAASIRWAADLVAAQPVAWNAVFAAVQVALGIGIALRPTLRLALAGSVAWALIVWWFGEGLGGLLTGSASALGGAPGAVLLYAVLAVLLWPVASTAPSRAQFVAERPARPTVAKGVWLVLWAGLAALNLQPSNLSADAVHNTVAGMGDGQPGWIAACVNGFAAVSRGNGSWMTVVGTVILCAIAAAVLLPPQWQRAGVVLAVVVALFIWLFGQALGAVFGGQSTDVNSGPLLILIALAYWPQRQNRIETGELA